VCFPTKYHGADLYHHVSRAFIYFIIVTMTCLVYSLRYYDTQFDLLPPASLPMRFLQEHQTHTRALSYDAWALKLITDIR